MVYLVYFIFFLICTKGKLNRFNFFKLFFFFIAVILFFFFFFNFIFLFFSYSLLKVFNFERGFSSLGKINKNFLVHFYFMFLIFVLFDLESVLFFGLIIFSFKNLLLFIIIFILVFERFILE